MADHPFDRDEAARTALSATRPEYVRLPPPGSQNGHTPHAGDGGQRRHLRVLTDLEAQALEPSPGLIGNVLFTNSSALLYGPWGSLKTFLALDWALCVGTDTPWLDTHAVQSGHVVYICAEGAQNIGQRISAWKRYHGWPVDTPAHFTLIADVVNLLDAGDVHLLVEQVERLNVIPALIVFDTVAWAMLGSDENSATSAGLVIGAMRQLRERWECTVLGVHHAGKDATRGARGSNAFAANVDTVIAVEPLVDVNRFQLGDPIRLSCEKQKDADRFKPITLVSALVTVNLDAPIDAPNTSSLVLVKPFTRTPQRGKPIDTTPSKNAFTAAAIKAWKELAKRILTAPDGITFTDWQVAACRNGAMAPSTFKTAVSQLKQGGWVVQDDKLYRVAVPGEDDQHGT